MSSIFISFSIYCSFFTCNKITSFTHKILYFLYNSELVIFYHTFSFLVIRKIPLLKEIKAKYRCSSFKLLILSFFLIDVEMPLDPALILNLHYVSLEIVYIFFHLTILAFFQDSYND